jgi:Catalase
VIASENKGPSPDLASATAHDEVWEGRACDHPLAKENRMPTGTLTNPALAQQLLDALDALSGLHPGFRPAHAKGLMCSGMFTPSPEAAHLTRAPHASRPSTAVTVRYSNATGVPTIPDNDPARSGPRGMAIRFHLAEHVHTDIVAHSTNGFPFGNAACTATTVASGTAGKGWGRNVMAHLLAGIRHPLQSHGQHTRRKPYRGSCRNGAKHVDPSAAKPWNSH